MGFETSGPNELMVVSGLCYPYPKYIPGGRVFVWPGIQKVQRLSLNLMTLTVDSNNMKTKKGVPINLTGTAQIKICGSNIELTAAACEIFLGKTEEEISAIVLQTLEGHQSTLICSMDPEEIYSDRNKFCRALFEVASCDLINMGVMIVSYTVKEISDDQGFFKELGRRRAQEAKASYEKKLEQS